MGMRGHTWAHCVRRWVRCVPLEEGRGRQARGPAEPAEWGTCMRSTWGMGERGLGEVRVARGVKAAHDPMPSAAAHIPPPPQHTHLNRSTGVLSL
jgi:hypothetical protein